MSQLSMDAMATGYGLIEGPVWAARRGLLFSDVPNGGVYCLSPSGAVTTVVEHRRGIGGMALHADGGLVVSGRNIGYKGPVSAETVVLLDRDAAAGIVGFNDLTTDSAGRVYVGSLCSSPFDRAQQERPTPGWLHVIDLDGTSRRLHGDTAAPPTRSAGTFSSAPSTTASTSRGTLGRTVRIDGTGAVMWRATIADAFGPVNGGSPTSISNSTHPNEYTSVRPSTDRSPDACSGLMYAGVPTDTPVDVNA